MLEPQDRRLVLETLRPPAGYALDAAIGTTYSLDLTALLITPLAFALFDAEDENGRVKADPLTLVEAVRRHADRIAIFCQAGEIKVPTGDSQLLTYLEEAVVGARARDDFSFHPKLWSLRFAPRQPDQPVIYRVVCMSRNLTFDRSWDTTVVLEGELLDRQRAVSAANHALADFVQALPEFAAGEVSARVRAEADRMQKDLRVVRFEVPEPFDEVGFWPLGRPGWKSPFSNYRPDRVLVVSPFLSDGFLRTIAESGSGHMLVSRAESLAASSRKVLEDFKRLCTLADGAEPEAEDGESSSAATIQGELTGLHAKVYLAEDGWNASLLTGSANATTAGFGGNVEFLVELRGKKSKCGIEALLAPSQGQPSLAGLLQEFQLPPEEAEEPKAATLEELIAKAKRAIVDSEPRARVTQAEEDLFDLTLLVGGLRLPEGVAASCWPITVRGESARDLGQGAQQVSFTRLPMTGLSAFVAFELVARDADGHEESCRFVLKVPVDGMPAGRRERVLKAILRDGAQVLRLLLLLLEDPEEAGFGDLLAGQAPEGQALGAWAGGSEAHLFESLLRTLSRSPERLDDVIGLVRELKASPETAGLLPPGFDEVWQPIQQVRESERSSGEQQQG